jgi:thioredoxin reductase
MPLYGSLFVADGTKESLLGIWEAIIANTGVQVRTNERVESVQRNTEGQFAVTTSRGSYAARHVVLAMGKRGTPRRLGVPGEELPKVTYRLIEADDYAGKHVLVVGGGDSAVEAALALAKAGRNHVTLSYRGEAFQRARERNRSLLEEAAAAHRVRVLLSSHVDRIDPDAVTLNVNGAVEQLGNDFVFVMIGGDSPEDFLRRTGIEIVAKTL